MRCHHPSRATWWRGCIQRLHDFCCHSKTRTYPQLTRLPVDGLECWFSGNDQPDLNPDDQYPADFHSIICRHHNVGWKHMTLCDGLATSAGSLFQSLIGLINIQWEQSFILWAERNQNMYGRDAQKRQSQLQQEVHRQL